MTVESELESPTAAALPPQTPSPAPLSLFHPLPAFFFSSLRAPPSISTSLTLPSPFLLLISCSPLPSPLSLYHLSPHAAAPQSLISARWAAECYACRKRGHVEFMLVSACCSRRRHIWAMGLGWNTSDCMMNAEWGAGEGEILPTTPAAPNPSPLSSQPSSCRRYCGARAPFRFLHPDHPDGVRVVFFKFQEEL